MAETSDYDPGDWKGHDFASARASYDTYAKRSYATATITNKKVEDLIPKKLITHSPRPLFIACDVTGSMGDRPTTIFSKLPYLDIEGKEYLGPEMEICFGGIGDHLFDTYFLQLCEFNKGTVLKEELQKLIIEKGGGGNKVESYELMALYLARNFEFPNAISKPIVIFIGDEGFDPCIQNKDAERIGISLQQLYVHSKDIFNELMEKCSVYMVRSPYNDSYHEKKIHKQWVELLGEERIAMLSDANRIVDVIFGILAKEVDKIDYFKAELEGRQTKEQVKTVYQSLKTVHLLPSKKEDEGKSRMLLNVSDVKTSKGLL